MSWFDRVKSKATASGFATTLAPEANDGIEVPDGTEGNETDGTANEGDGGCLVPLRIAAADLWRAFRRNSIAADDEFNGAYLEVRGRVDTVERDYKGRIVVSLMVGELFGRVKCRFPEERRGDVLPLVKDGKVSIRGTCAAADHDYVLLDDCTVGQHAPPPVEATARAAS
ncbi:OB-fold putative lipoprotein [Myxococcota bacterium]|nr:OB-fold putative lipoprotein [Myxococcota bacterium]